MKIIFEYNQVLFSMIIDFRFVDFQFFFAIFRSFCIFAIEFTANNVDSRAHLFVFSFIV